MSRNASWLIAGFVVVAAAAQFAACGPGDGGAAAPPSAAPAPAAPSDARLRDLERAAEVRGSADLVVWFDGRCVVDRCFESARRRLPLNSVTKSIAGLAFGALAAEGRRDLLDRPLGRDFPAWASDRRGSLTVRQVMNHTTGLRAYADATSLWQADDALGSALAADLVQEPGTSFAYDNRAVNLLAEVVRIAAGRPLDDYLAKRVFAPLGIADFAWRRDAHGVPWVMAGLEMRADDLARLGRLLLNRGRHEGRTLIDPDWIDDATVGRPEPEPTAGLLWRTAYSDRRCSADAALLARWRAAGVPASWTARCADFAPEPVAEAAYFRALESRLGGRAELDALLAALDRAKTPASRTAYAGTAAYYAEGELGIYLVAAPTKRLVAVRTAARLPAANARDGFPEFVDAVLGL